MFNVLFKKLVKISWGSRVSVTQPGYLGPNSLHISRSLTSSSVAEDTQLHSFTVSYLINSCGLSPDAAISASRRVSFQKPDRPDSILTLLRNHGLTVTQISKVVRARPNLLLANPEMNLLPKIEFFLSIGVSRADLAKILSKNPSLLSCSLENRLIPYFNFLKSEVLLSDEEVVRALKRTQRIFLSDVQKNVNPNITVLRELGMPQSSLSKLVTCFTHIVLYHPDKFNKIVKEVIDMGFNAKKLKFIFAMNLFSGMTKSTREYKMDIYRSWGWSEDEIVCAVRKHPNFMSISEKKIMSVMDFLVNKMGWQSSAIARYPLVLNLSLEKRVIPRCLVITILQLKGFVRKDLPFGSFLHFAEEGFLDEFVTKYQEDVTELLNVYQGKIGLQKLGFGFGDIYGIRPL